MADVVNLRMARKRRARADKERKAEENRVRFGRTGAERALSRSRADKARRHLDERRLDGPDDE